MARMKGHRRPHPAGTSIQEYSRGVLGGLIFSMPLLLTSEVWLAGSGARPERLLAGLAGTFCLLLAYNAVAGIRHEYEPVEVLIESVEELGLGLVVSFLVLALLARIRFDMPLAEVVGQVVVAAFTVAIGVSVGTAQLGGDTKETGEAAAPGSRDPAGRHGISSIAVLSLCGAIILSANVAPTEEVLVLGATLPPRLLLVVVAASLSLAAVMLFYSEFQGSSHLASARALSTVLHACVVAYAMALLSGAMLLWFFGRFERVTAGVMIGQVVVLALPGTLGAAAGRLLLR